MDRHARAEGMTIDPHFSLLPRRSGIAVPP